VVDSLAWVSAVCLSSEVGGNVLLRDWAFELVCDLVCCILNLALLGTIGYDHDIPVGYERAIPLVKAAVASALVPNLRLCYAAKHSARWIMRWH